MSESGKNTSKRFTVRFGYGGLVAACFTGCVVLVWIFVLGVLVGKGVVTDPFDLPILDRLQWKSAPTEPPQVVTPEVMAEVRPETKPPAPVEPERSEPQEVELDFYARLDKKKADIPGVLTQKVEDPKKTSGIYTVQLASFKDGAKAQEYMKQMAAKDINCYMSPAKSGDQQWYRVRTGRLDDLAAARALVAELEKKHGIKALAVKLN